jgi:uncharacterized protein (TIGR03067 family)
MRSYLAFLWSAASLVPLCAADMDSVAKEKEKLQGTWAAVSVVDNGRSESTELLKTLKLTIKGDKYIFRDGDWKLSAAYKIDPTKKPKQMSITFEEGPKKGKTMLAIYSVEGDKLKICGGDRRPTEFASKRKSEVILFEFKREKP